MPVTSPVPEAVPVTVILHVAVPVLFYVPVVVPMPREGAAAVGRGLLMVVGGR